jgi:hypothetical protein
MVPTLDMDVRLTGTPAALAAKAANANIKDNIVGNTNSSPAGCVYVFVSPLIVSLWNVQVLSSYLGSWATRPFVRQLCSTCLRNVSSDKILVGHFFRQQNLNLKKNGASWTSET